MGTCKGVPLFLIIFPALCAFSQNGMYGVVSDYETGGPVVGAKVTRVSTGEGCFTDSAGNFAFASTVVSFRSFEESGKIGIAIRNAVLTVYGVQNYTKVNVYSLSGRTVFSQVVQAQSEIHIDLSPLPAGLLYVELKNDNHRVGWTYVHGVSENRYLRLRDAAGRRSRYSFQAESGSGEKVIVDHADYFTVTLSAYPDRENSIRLRPLRVQVLENYQNGDTVGYPLVRLWGRTSLEEGEVKVTHGDSLRVWPVFRNQFKALVKLAPGFNEIRLQVEDTVRVLFLNFSQPEITYDVQWYWFTGSDGEVTMDSPPGIDNDRVATLKRVQTAALLLQTFFAETFRDAREIGGEENPGRLTFHSSLGEGGYPEVSIIQHPTMTRRELWERNDAYQDYTDLSGILESATLPGNVQGRVYFGFSGICHRDTVSGEYKAHAALGSGGTGQGGGIAFCPGSSNITFPVSWDQVDEAFSNSTILDEKYIVSPPDEINDFGPYWWGRASTMLSAMLHEGGHALSMPHPRDINPHDGLNYADSIGIMDRSYWMFLFFMPYVMADDGVTRNWITWSEEAIASYWWSQKSVNWLMNMIPYDKPENERGKSPFIY